MVAGVFPRLALAVHAFASNSDWFIALFTCAVIGQSNYFGFGFTTLITFTHLCSDREETVTMP